MTQGQKWLRRAGIGLSALVILLGAGWWLIGPDWRALLANPPSGRDVLFWSVPQRDAAFRMLDALPMIIESRPIKAGGAVRPLPEGEPLDLGGEVDLDAFFEAQNGVSLVIVQDGRIRLERYANGFTRDGRWTSFSVAKSLTSSLVGAAMKDGHIRSLEDKVTDYIPDLAGSPYDDVTVAQLLTMTSGVAWNEDYEDPQSDVALFDKQAAEDGKSGIVTYMRTLGRAHPPGEVWNYSTGETNLIGVLVSAATGKPVAEYLSEKIWKPYGMEQDATWLLGQDGHEISGCCIQATTRDFARYGQFILDGGVTPEGAVLPAGWLAQATVRQADIGEAGFGYGFQWWTWDDGAFQADGIFGQGIFIDPARKLVIASNANWKTALGLDDKEWPERADFYRAVQAAVDREAGP
ncbi:MAG: beta-lactamase family protein [Hyphomonas sp.]|uniref:serine hydrolase domain-containing protein n=1 Tax=Hyphomonas sp. TaxID=87 RepID=UPI00184E511A|nr:serine hydrolase domain-containing protein [Hyphomonas sp.]MBA3067309.1 beta-lactamase family protein [Hyphomonas sp.]MBU3919020.1 beta-lactamase family protein [Alphaproteobacteria bacterium]MBU4062998.1 beta-lactamase family protein [Alphaproteobacteria bacterium]MBU4163579.1 beta-lactamase family protein [Alphaproteobacteria bacterium]